MMGQQLRTHSLFYYFRLEEQIPEDHLLRLIDRHVDLSFVRDLFAGVYLTEQPGFWGSFQPNARKPSVRTISVRTPSRSDGRAECARPSSR